MTDPTVNGTAEAVCGETHPQTHDLKIGPDYFDAVSDGIKRFELRLNDRDFRVGDRLILREWAASGYTGRCVRCKVDYILSCYDGLDHDYVILSITLI